MENREKQLERCVRRLLDTPDLNLDELEEETRDAIREALTLIGEMPPIEVSAPDRRI